MPKGVKRVRRLADMQPMIATALSGGGSISRLATVEWDVAGHCLNPRRVTHEGRPDVNERRTRGPSPVWVDMETRCRRCVACLRARARYWQQRCQVELQAASRTWFSTLTVSPENHYLALCQAEVRAVQASVSPISEWSEDERFLARHSVLSQEITLWLKRVRKQSGADLRYIIVCEKHKSGLPHYHALIHEVSADKPVRERELRLQWRHGFSLHKLVDPLSNSSATARYVTKYLTKSAEARVRASLCYGKPPSVIVPQDVNPRPSREHECSPESALKEAV